MQGLQYDFAGWLSYWQRFTGVGADYSGNQLNTYAAETLGYNINGQLTSQVWSFQNSYMGWGAAAGIQYVYPSTQNNGQIAQAVEAWSGQSITYQYDGLKRLTAAASAQTGSSPPAAWTENFQYDGFGNLTAKVLNGAATSIPVNGATNRLSNAGYDANGNMNSGAGAGLTHDVANRVVAATETSGGTETYAYAPDGKRIFRAPADGSAPEWTFWGAKGEKLGTFALVYSPYGGTYSHPYSPVLSPTLSFAGRTIWDGTKTQVQDRIGTNRATGARYYPFGDEITSTANDAAKFGTYHRDAFTGLDCADQRYYASTYGRFNTPDPYQAAAKGANSPTGPLSWNRYSYVLGDPINGFDPRGLFLQVPADPGCDGDQYSAACDGGEGGESAGGEESTGGGGSAPLSPSAKTILDAERGAADRLFNPKCAGLFLAPDANTAANRALLSQRLDILEDSGSIREIDSSGISGGANPNVPAFTTASGGLIYIVSGGAFFTGTVNGTPLGGFASGMNLTSFQQLIIIHEFLHQYGIAGADASGQKITLANGDTVTGSQGISKEIKKDCFNQQN